MKIREELLANKVFVRSDAVRISEYACEISNHFNELTDCFLSDEYRLSQRAAWCLSYAARGCKERLAAQLQRLLDLLDGRPLPHFISRNLFRVLQDTEIPEQYHGRVIDSAFRFIENNDTPVAVKAFALTVLFNLSALYPDIRQELKLVIGERMEHETAAFASRAKKIIRAIG